MEPRYDRCRWRSAQLPCWDVSGFTGDGGNRLYLGDVVGADAKIYIPDNVELPQRPVLHHTLQEGLPQRLVFNVAGVFHQVGMTLGQGVTGARILCRRQNMVARE